MANILIILRRIIYWTVADGYSYFVRSLIAFHAFRNCQMTVETEGANQVGRTREGMRHAVQNGLVATLFLVGIAVGFASSAHAGTDIAPVVPASGSVSGTTRNVLGEAVPRVKVTVHRLEGDVDRTVISSVAGNFGLNDLKPGHYELMASNEGANPPAAVVEVAAGQSAKVDVIAANTAAQPETTVAAGPVPSADRSTAVADPALPPAVTRALEAMQARIQQLETELKARSVPEQSSTAAAGIPAKAGAPA